MNLYALVLTSCVFESSLHKNHGMECVEIRCSEQMCKNQNLCTIFCSFQSGSFREQWNPHSRYSPGSVNRQFYISLPDVGWNLFILIYLPVYQNHADGFNLDMDFRIGSI